MRKIAWLGLLLAAALAVSAASAEALSDQEKLGGLIYRDTNLSLNFNQSCMTCHHPSAGFQDPANRRDPLDFPVSQGSDPTNYGGRNAPTAAYAGFSPVFHWDEVSGGYVGGMFWDGRATGQDPLDPLGDPLAEQARGPFQNPVEMGLLPAEVVARVAASNYAVLFETVYPQTDWQDVTGTYNNIARAIAAFERSQAVTRFTSKFDLFWEACAAAGIDVSTITETTDPATLPQGILTTGELRGLALFNGKAGCAACHTTSAYVDNAVAVAPLFTDYTYDNIGIPTNPVVEALSGVAPPDLGLGGWLGESEQNGKFKVPTLRNVAKSPPYGHNGFFVTLDEVVNFYNTRNLSVSIWFTFPAEVPETVNIIDIGDLGLSAREEQWIVAFLHTLTDRRQ